MNIYACGNTLVKQDCLPLKILPTLKKKNKKIKFIEFDPTENLPEEKELIIIDTIINAKKNHADKQYRQVRGDKSNIFARL